MCMGEGCVCVDKCIFWYTTSKQLPNVYCYPNSIWEDPAPIWEQEMATHSNTLAWETQWTEEPEGDSPWGHRESDTTQ